MLRYANYNGNAEHLIGEEVWAPFLRKGGAETQTVRWVATDAGYNEETGKTRVEFYGEIR
jgi:hypothetical protein